MISNEAGHGHQRFPDHATVAMLLVGAGIAALGVIAVMDLFLMLNGG